MCTCLRVYVCIARKSRVQFVRYTLVYVRYQSPVAIFRLVKEAITERASERLFADRSRSPSRSLSLCCSVGVTLVVTRNRPIAERKGNQQVDRASCPKKGGRRRRGSNENKRDTRKTSVPERGGPVKGRGQGRILLVQAVVALVRVEPLVQNGNCSLPGRVAGTCLLELTGTRADPLGPATVVRGRGKSQSLLASCIPGQVLARRDGRRR